MCTLQHAGCTDKVNVVFFDVRPSLFLIPLKLHCRVYLRAKGAEDCIRTAGARVQTCMQVRINVHILGAFPQSSLSGLVRKILRQVNCDGVLSRPCLRRLDRVHQPTDEL